MRISYSKAKARGNYYGLIPVGYNGCEQETNSIIRERTRINGASVSRSSIVEMGLGLDRTGGCRRICSIKIKDWIFRRAILVMADGRCSAGLQGPRRHVERFFVHNQSKHPHLPCKSWRTHQSR